MAKHMHKDRRNAVKAIALGQFKNSEEERRVMCKAVEGLVEKGKRETMLATAKRLLVNGKLMLKEIAECTGLSLAEVKKLQASMA